jgi:hypothetical protein
MLSGFVMVQETDVPGGSNANRVACRRQSPWARFLEIILARSRSPCSLW